MSLSLTQWGGKRLGETYEKVEIIGKRDGSNELERSTYTKEFVMRALDSCFDVRIFQ